MSRPTITTTAALAAAALALPVGASAAPVGAAAHLEASAVVNSSQAVDQVSGSAAKARRSVQRSARALARAYAITVSYGKQASAGGLQSAAKFSAAAEAQGENLQAVVEKSRGGLKAAAADALARTGRMQAKLSGEVADGLDRQQSTASAQQGENVAELGDNQAQLTAAVAVTASSQGLRDAAQAQLDKVTAASVEAQARLVRAVGELRDRTEEQGSGSMTSARVSLQRSGAALAAALRRSGRWEVSYEKTIATRDGGPVSGSASLKAQATVDAGERR